MTIDIYILVCTFTNHIRYWFSIINLFLHLVLFYIQIIFLNLPKLICKIWVSPTSASMQTYKRWFQCISNVLILRSKTEMDVKELCRDIWISPWDDLVFTKNNDLAGESLLLRLPIHNRRKEVVISQEILMGQQCVCHWRFIICS